MDGVRKVWCTVGDDYELVTYPADTPCRKKDRIFLLEDATYADGDFQVFYSSMWTGPVSLASPGLSMHEQMYLNFYLPISLWDRQLPDEKLEQLRVAVEKALHSEEFQNEVEDILKDGKVSVVARTNAYYGH